jgi:drug/metabolite transporter (DMT)-like permease
MSGDYRRGVIWALISSIATAGFVIPWKIANTIGDPRINTLILLVAAASFSCIWIMIQQRRVPRFGRFDFGFALVLAVLTLAGNLASAHAIVDISPSLLTVIQRADVIVVALMAWPLIGERFDRRFVIGAAIAGLGLVVLQDPFANGGFGRGGMGLALLSMLFFSAMAVLTRKYIQRIEPVAVNALRLWISVGLWFGINGLPEELYEISRDQIWYASLTAFFGPFMGRLFLMTSAKYIEARITALIMLVSPPMTLVLAYLLLDDLPSGREILGGLIMLAGIAIPILVWSNSRRAD